MHVVWRYSSDFCVICLQFVLSHSFLGGGGEGLSFSLPKHVDTGHLVNAIPPTIFNWVSIKFCRCFCQGLKMCTRFDCNPPMFFVTFLQL